MSVNSSPRQPGFTGEGAFSNFPDHMILMHGGIRNGGRNNYYHNEGLQPNSPVWEERSMIRVAGLDRDSPSTARQICR